MEDKNPIKDRLIHSQFTNFICHSDLFLKLVYPSPQELSIFGKSHGTRQPDRKRHQRDPLPVDRQTPVKTLPCPKLRLRTIKIYLEGKSWGK